MEQNAQGEARTLVVTCNTVGVEVENSWDWRVEHENGTGSAKSEINLVADRYHRDNTLSCQVNSRALKVTDK